MNSFKKFFVLSALISTLFSSSRGLAVVNLAGLLGVSMTNESISAVVPVTVTAKSSFSYGLLANLVFPIGSSGLSFGLLRVDNLTHENYTIVTPVDVDVKVPYWQIPVTYDFWLGSFLALGIGGYYAIPAGNVVSGSQSQSFSDAGYKSDDYGLAAKAQLDIPIGAVTFVTASAVYEYGIEQISTASGSTGHNSAFLLYGGVGIGF